MSQYYSCGSHVVEPPIVFAGLEERFGSRAPRVVQNPNGRFGTFVVYGETLINVGRLGIAGSCLDDSKTHERIALGYDGLNPGVHNPEARLKEQEVDGVLGEVMYPSVNMAAFSYPERDVVQAVFCHHNDWMHEYCSIAPERLIGIACLPLPDTAMDRCGQPHLGQRLPAS